MGSISNPGISNLAQILSNSGASLAAAALTSPTNQAGLDNASTGDLVQLSEQALQLQNMEGLFAASAAPSVAGLYSGVSAPGISAFTTPDISSLFTTNNDLVSSLDNSLLSSLSTPANSLSSTSTASSNSPDGSHQTGSNAASNSSSPSDQLAIYQADLLAQQTQALFGSEPSAGSDTSTVNLLA